MHMCWPEQSASCSSLCKAGSPAVSTRPEDVLSHSGGQSWMQSLSTAACRASSLGVVDHLSAIGSGAGRDLQAGHLAHCGSRETIHTVCAHLQPTFPCYAAMPAQPCQSTGCSHSSLTCCSMLKYDTCVQSSLTGASDSMSLCTQVAL
jgi:hypothetical protein